MAAHTERHLSLVTEGTPAGAIPATGREHQANPANPERQTPRWRLASTAKTEMSPSHSKNEDRYYTNNETGVFGVFDGLGGHPAGDVAAQIATDTIADFEFTSQGSEQDIAAELLAALHKAHGAIIDQIKNNPDQYTKDHPLYGRLGMSTTATIARIVEREDGLYLVGITVGDSPIFVRQEGVTEELGTNAGGGNVVETSLGHTRKGFDPSKCQTLSKKLTPEVRILLCTDGVSGDTDAQLLSLKEIDECLSVEDRDAAASALDAKSRKRDDTTSVIIDIQEITEASSTQQASPSGRRRGSRGGGRAQDKKAAAGRTAASRGQGTPASTGAQVNPDGDPHTTLPEGGTPNPKPRPAHFDPHDFDPLDRTSSTAAAVVPPARTHHAPQPPSTSVPSAPSSPPQTNSAQTPPATATSTARPSQPAPASPNTGGNQQPTSTNRFERMDVVGLRNTLAGMQNRKRWGVYGIRNRKEMQAVREAYDSKVRESIVELLTEEVANGTLAANPAAIAQRKIAFQAEEAREWFAAMNAPNAVGSKYGKAVRKVGDLLYGKERNVIRRIAVTAGLGGAAVLLASAGGVAAAAGAGSIRLFKMGAQGVSGHDSQKGTERVFTKIQSKGKKDVQARTDRQLAKITSGSPASDAIEALVQQGEFSEAYLKRANASDTRRRVASMALYAAGAGGILHLSNHLDIKIQRPSWLGGNGSAKKELVGKLHGTTAEQHKYWRDAGVSDLKTRQSIIDNPDQATRFFKGLQDVREQSGLRGQALQSRYADTFELARKQNAEVQTMVKNGLTRAAAERQFSTNFKNMVNTDRFFGTISDLKAQGFSGIDLTNRVMGALDVAKARDLYIAQRGGVSDPNTLDYLSRTRFGREFDANFRRFVASA